MPEELWPQGEGKEGLLYGTHPSSGNTHDGTEETCHCRISHLMHADKERVVDPPVFLTSAEPALSFTATEGRRAALPPLPPTPSPAAG